MKALSRKIRRAYQWSRFRLERASRHANNGATHFQPGVAPQLRAQLEHLGKIFWLEEEPAYTNHSRLVAAANEICAHTFNLLGSGNVKVDHQLQAQGFAGHRYHMPVSNAKLERKRRYFKSYVEGLALSSSNVIREESALALEKFSSTAHATDTNALLGDYELIDWFVDFRSGYRWPEKLWHQKVPYGHQPGVDIKVPWELARFQHLLALGQAYRATEAAKYAHEFAQQILDWIFHNPQSCGLHWARAMEVALRAMHWIFSAHFFAHAQELPPAFWKELLKSLFQHGAFIRNHLEISRTAHGGRLTANHYLANIAGLVLLGILFHETPDGKEWLAFGVRELNHEMKSQVYSDGVHFEASTHYHKLAAALFLCATRAAVDHGLRFERDYLQQLEKMIDFIHAALKPDGALPLLGDDDASALAIFEASYGAPRAGYSEKFLLSRLCRLFDEIHARAEKDSSRMKSCEKKPGILESKAFPVAGIYILRHREDYLIADCGPCGQNGNGGHAHNDALSFELSADGENFIVDPGTFTYTAEEQLRNLFRGTAAHNVVMVDEEEMQPFTARALFSLPENTPPQVLAFETQPHYDYLVAQHYGYMRLPAALVHRRHFLFNKKERYWLIRDEMLGSGRHRYCIALHFAPGVITEMREELGLQVEHNGITLAVFPYHRERIRAQPTTGWIAPSYGRCVRGEVLQYLGEGLAPFALITAFYLVREQNFDHAAARARMQKFCASVDKAELLRAEPTHSQIT